MEIKTTVKYILDFGLATKEELARSCDVDVKTLEHWCTPVSNKDQGESTDVARIKPSKEHIAKLNNILNIHAVKVKLYPTLTEQGLLNTWRILFVDLYNAAVEQRGAAYKKWKAKGLSEEGLSEEEKKKVRELKWGFLPSKISQYTEISKKNLEKEGLGGLFKRVPNQLIRSPINDLDQAWKNHFRRRKEGEKTKPPSFKSRYKDFSFGTSDIGSIYIKDNKIYLPNYSKGIRFRSSGNYNFDSMRAIRFLKEGRDWFACITLVRGKYQGENPSGSIGLDMGVMNPVHDSEGNFARLPSTLSKGDDSLDRKIKRLQRKAAKQEKFSGRWKDTEAKIAKLHKQKARVRDAWGHKVSKYYASTYANIAMEDLKTKQMTKSAKGTVEKPGRNVRQKAGLNRSVLNVGWYALRKKVEYKTKYYGGHLELVSPQHTSQECSECHFISKENRKTQAEFVCMNCGYAENADFNAAKNIKNRAFPKVS